MMTAQARAEKSAEAFAALSPSCLDAITSEPYGGVVPVVCDYSYLDLTNFILIDGIFDGCRFDNAILTGAKLFQASIDTASFRGAILDGANMMAVSCSNAVFDGASMTGTILQARDIAEISPRYSRDIAEISPRYGTIMEARCVESARGRQGGGRGGRRVRRVDYRSHTRS